MRGASRFEKGSTEALLAYVLNKIWANFWKKKFFFLKKFQLASQFLKKFIVSFF